MGAQGWSEDSVAGGLGQGGRQGPSIGTGWGGEDPEGLQREGRPGLTLRFLQAAGGWWLGPRRRGELQIRRRREAVPHGRPAAGSGMLGWPLGVGVLGHGGWVLCHKQPWLREPLSSPTFPSPELLVLVTEASPHSARSGGNPRSPRPPMEALLRDCRCLKSPHFTCFGAYGHEGASKFRGSKACTIWEPFLRNRTES